MNLHEAQRTIVADKHRFRVINAGRRFGKTVIAIEELLFAATTKDNANVAYVAPTYIQAREISWAMLKRRVYDITGVQINEVRLELTLPNKFGSTSKITLKGWESIDSLRGQSFDFLVLDEVAMYRDFQYGWEEVVRPTLTDRKGAVLFISTPRGFNFWYDLYNKEHEDKDYKSFHYTSYDNPHIPHEELDKAKEELTEDRFSQEILADFRKTEGLVYKEFSRSQHIFTDIQQVPNRVERLVGIDWGYTNPTGITVFDRDRDENFWLVGEYYKTGKTTQEIIEYAKTLGGNAFYPDPAEPDRIEECRRAGMNVREVSKDIEAGINSVHTLLKNNKLKVYQKCVNFISEIETYTYREKLPGQNEREEPNKEHDHLMDSMRYVLHMQGMRFANNVAKQFAPTNTQAYRRSSPRVGRLVQ